ncbi:MAG: hypothetical protein IIU47_08085 [Lachnospiraceae bacterium]|nr:hypothetical protein [Lachnospiraceae bacterium]MBQ3973862.1 hypothetical protein [Lachnospiraceae bacterium]MBQ4303312.1 hypothetical protein [Lachnospiraceae bacterium]MBQ5360984.1 hypothetical protein [Lachnospiraceae bacterium]
MSGIIILGVICVALSLIFSVLAFLAKITWGLFRLIVWPVAVFFGALLVVGWLMGHVVLPGVLILLVIVGLLIAHS